MSETGAVEPRGRLARLARWPLDRLGEIARGVLIALPRAIEDLFRDRCTQYAASIAYRVLFSLFPLTIFLVSIFGFVLQDDELRQRVIASCHLGPMDEAETAAYILHRLQTVGWHEDPTYSADAFDAIHKYTGGIPRRINLLCDRLMLMGSLDKKHALTGSDVAQVIEEMQQEFAPIGPVGKESVG